jgi:hypothetical protein
VLLEQQCQQLQQQLSDSTLQLERLQQQQQGQLQRECDKRIAAVKASAAADKEALSARHAAKIKKLQEAAKDQVGVKHLCFFSEGSCVSATSVVRPLLSQVHGTIACCCACCVARCLHGILRHRSLLHERPAILVPSL